LVAPAGFLIAAFDLETNPATFSLMSFGSGRGSIIKIASRMGHPK
jgi:hypothetical protein